MELDSCWSEQEVVSADMKPYWPNAPDSTSRQLCFPFVDLMDTTGVRLLHIPGARDPSWSRDGAQLAYRVVRKPIQRIGGKIFSYPESSDSIVVLTIRTDSRAAYPIASSELAWLDEGILLFDSHGLIYNIKVGTDEPHSTRLRMPFVGNFSEDGDYSFEVAGRNGWDLGIWGIVEGRELSRDVLHTIGDDPKQISAATFWLRGTGHKHDLCVGVTWVPWTMPKPGGPQLKRHCEVVVIDPRTNTISRRIQGALIGPTADRTAAVIWQEGKITFLEL